MRFVCSAQKKLVFRKIDLIPKDTVLQKGQKPPEERPPAQREPDAEEQPAFYVTTNEPNRDRQP